MGSLALNGWRRIATASIAAFAAWLANAPSARADGIITVSYDFVETRVSPRQETIRSHISANFSLSTKKGVDLSVAGAKTRAKLGGSVPGFDAAGQAATTTFHIVNGAFVVTTRHPGNFSVLRIVTDGRTSCSATMTYFRNPGHQYFEATTMNQVESILASDFQAQNMTCSISE
jgi:hypothetical protein